MIGELVCAARIHFSPINYRGAIMAQAKEAAIFVAYVVGALLVIKYAVKPLAVQFQLPYVKDL